MIFYLFVSLFNRTLQNDYYELLYNDRLKKTKHLYVKRIIS